MVALELPAERVAGHNRHNHFHLWQTAIRDASEVRFHPVTVVVVDTGGGGGGGRGGGDHCGSKLNHALTNANANINTCKTQSHRCGSSVDFPLLQR
jgi:hypothetical protein